MITGNLHMPLLFQIEHQFMFILEPFSTFLFVSSLNELFPILCASCVLRQTQGVVNSSSILGYVSYEKKKTSFSLLFIQT